MDDLSKYDELSLQSLNNTKQSGNSNSPIYEPLPICGDDIRIINLKPGAPSDPTRCELVVRSLEDLNLNNTSQPQSHLLLYEALSYAWGSLYFHIQLFVMVTAFP